MATARGTGPAQRSSAHQDGSIMTPTLADAVPGRQERSMLTGMER
jgi:hypothetical protein